jgi:hypothetical protein
MVVSVTLAACASPPPPLVPDTDVAYLQNRVEFSDNAKLTYFFQYAGDEKLGPGEWSLTLPTKAVNKIPPGPTTIGLMITYVPYHRKGFFERINDHYHYIFVRDKGYSEEDLGLIQLALADGTEISDLSGLRGLHLDAKGGQVYRIAARIEGGRAHIWIENRDGEAVTDTVVGFADAWCFAQSPWRASSLNKCFPDSDGQWAVLTNLPGSVNQR